MDTTDIKILKIIKKEARLSYSDIGEQVGLSRVAVKNRMEAMEEKGIIEGYYTKINKLETQGRMFFVDIITEPNQYDSILNRLVEEECIKKVYSVTGESHIKAEGFASNVKYESFLKNIRSHSEGIKGMTIHDVLYVAKDTER